MKALGIKKLGSVESVDVLARVPIRESELDRFKFGKKWYYELEGSEKGHEFLCLDVGCGAKPFPKADVLCDLCVKPVPDRRMRELVTLGKPFVLCDCRSLPFKDKAFDFVACYYVVEHVDDPIALSMELRRVSSHGYIQCPSWFNEIMYDEDVHKWIVIKRKNKLHIKPINSEKRFRLRFGFIFHRLYQSGKWQVLHAILDELFNVFTVHYAF